MHQRFSPPGGQRPVVPMAMRSSDQIVCHPELGQGGRSHSNVRHLHRAVGPDEPRRLIGIIRGEVREPRGRAGQEQRKQRWPRPPPNGAPGTGRDALR